MRPRTTRELKAELLRRALIADWAGADARDHLAPARERKAAEDYRQSVLSRARRVAELLTRRGGQAAKLARPFLMAEPE